MRYKTLYGTKMELKKGNPSKHICEHFVTWNNGKRYECDVCGKVLDKPSEKDTIEEKVREFVDKEFKKKGKMSFNDGVKLVIQKTAQLVREECDRKIDDMLMAKNLTILNSIIERKVNDARKSEREKFEKYIEKSREAVSDKFAELIYEYEIKTIRKPVTKTESENFKTLAQIVGTVIKTMETSLKSQLKKRIDSV